MSRILIISKCATHPTIAGNRQWILAQAELLKKMGHEVHFLYIQELPLIQDRKNFILDLVETKQYWGKNFHLYKVPLVDKLRMTLIKYWRIIFENGYLHCDDRYPYYIGKAIQELDEKYNFDACIVNYYYLTKLFKQTNIPLKALSTHDSFAYKKIKVDNPHILSLTAHQEAIAMQRSPHIFALQEQEANYFQLLSPKSKVYDMYGVFFHHPQPVAGNHKIVFLSGNNTYNVNGIRWFLSEIFPAILDRYPDAELIVGGSICNAIHLWKNYLINVKLYGFVDNPYLFYSQGDVAINPVFQGTGLKIKTFEAISFDKVTLVHPHSVTGIYHKDQAPLFVSDKKGDWVKALERVWESNSFIVKVKEHNALYLNELLAHIKYEYSLFLTSNNGKTAIH